MQSVLQATRPAGHDRLPCVRSEEIMQATAEEEHTEEQLRACFSECSSNTGMWMYNTSTPPILNPGPLGCGPVVGSLGTITTADTCVIAKLGTRDAVQVGGRGRRNTDTRNDTRSAQHSYHPSQATLLDSGGECALPGVCMACMLPPARPHSKGRKQGELQEEQF